MTLRLLIRDQSQLYDLLSDDHGGVYLAVLCGGIGMYEVSIQLNSDELERYRSGGKNYLDKLALDVCRETESFRHRNIHLAIAERPPSGRSR